MYYPFLRDLSSAERDRWIRKEEERRRDNKRRLLDNELPPKGYIRYVKRDLFGNSQEYVLQQCDCTSTSPPTQLDKDYLSAYPYADVYGERARSGQVDQAGTIRLYRPRSSPSPDSDNSTEESERSYGPIVVAMFTQVSPGKAAKTSKPLKSTKPDEQGDTDLDRYLYFENCLDKLGKLHPDEVALPDLFGCYKNTATWRHYAEALDRFSDAHPYSQIYVYKK